jgi:hypothetical protein
VAPTILEVAGLPEPTMVNGVQQSPIEGTSMAYTFADAGAREHHDLQYFEMFANRGVYFQGWTAVTKHRTPWVMVGGDLPAFDDDVWELYGPDDYSQAADLSAKMPDLLAKLQRLWLIEAVKYKRAADGRPDLRTDRTDDGRAADPDPGQLPDALSGGMGRLSENSVVSIKNKSFSVTAAIEVPDGGAQGVLVAQGGRFGGWSFYLEDGRAKFVAVGNSVLTIIWHVLSEPDTRYHDLGPSYHDTRINRQRRQRDLTRQLEHLTGKIVTLQSSPT